VGDEDTYWHVVLNRVGMPAIEHRDLKIKTVDQLLGIIDELWARQSEFPDDIPPPGLADQIQEYWKSFELEG